MRSMGKKQKPESKSRVLFNQFGLNVGSGQFARLDVPRSAEGGGDAGGLSHEGANWHDTEVGVRFVCSGNDASGEKESIDLFRNKATVGNRVVFPLREFRLCAIGVESCADRIVDIEVEVRLGNDPVGEDTSFEDILRRERIEALEVARFADTDGSGGREQETIFVSGGILPEEIDDDRDLLAADELCLCQVFRLCSIDLRDIGHIARHDAGQGSFVEKDMSGGGGEILSGESLNFSGGDIDECFEGRRKDGSAVIDATDTEHERHWLHDSIVFAAELICGAGAGGDIPIAGSVNRDFGEKRFATGFAFDDDAFQAIVFDDGICCERIETDFNTGFLQHFQQNAMEPFGIDGSAHIGAIGGAVEDFLVDTALGVAGPVAHQAARGNAADATARFDEAGFGAFAASGDGGGHAGGAAADDQYIVFPDNGDFFCGFMNRLLHMIIFRIIWFGNEASD